MMAIHFLILEELVLGPLETSRVVETAETWAQDWNPTNVKIYNNWFLRAHAEAQFAK